MGARFLCLLAGVAVGSMPLAQQPVRSVNHPPQPGGVSDMVFAVAGNEVHAVWLDARSGVEEIYYNRSSDSGRTWSATDLRVTHGPANVSKTVGGIAVLGAIVVVFTVDARSGSSQIYCDRSVDGGATWQAVDTRISFGGVSPVRPRIRVAAGVIHLGWFSNPISNVAVRSTDGGATWSPEAVVNADSGFEGGSTMAFAADGGTVLLAWIGRQSSTRAVLACRSTDGGETWQRAVRIDGGPTGVSSFVPQEVAIALGAGSAHVMWTDNRPGVPAERHVRLLTSTDGGATWPATSIVMESAAGSVTHTELQLSASGDFVHAAWRDGTALAASLRYRGSVDRGLTWQPADVPIERVALGPLTGGLAIRSAGPLVVAGWTTDGVACFNRSHDTGVHWLATDQTFGAGAGGNAFVADMALVPDNWHALVGQNRTVNDGTVGQVLLMGSQTYGPAHAGSQGIAPTCASTGFPLVGGTVSLRCERALGRTLMAWIGGTTGAANVPIGPWVLLVDAGELLGLAVTTGRFWQPGEGTATRALQVPDDPALLGTSFNVQAFFFDPGAVGLLSHTAGLELWFS